MDDSLPIEVPDFTLPAGVKLMSETKLFSFTSRVCWLQLLQVNCLPVISGVSCLCERLCANRRKGGLSIKFQLAQAGSFLPETQVPPHKFLWAILDCSLNCYVEHRLRKRIPETFIFARTKLFFNNEFEARTGEILLSVKIEITQKQWVSTSTQWTKTASCFPHQFLNILLVFFRKKTWLCT